MKNVFYFLFITLVAVSCSKESINNEDESDTFSFEKINIILPDGNVLSIENLNKEFSKNKDFEELQAFLDENKDLVIADFDDGMIRIFYGYDEAKAYYLKAMEFDSNKQNFNNKSSQIFGEVNVYDGNNNTGQQVTIRMSYGIGNRVTYQFPRLNNMRTQYNQDGTAIGQVVNMDNRISSLKIRNYGLIVLYNDPWYNGSTYLFSNNPDINGQPYERSINLPSHPFSTVFNKNNVHSSLQTTIDLN
ncbi:hypothetical protein [Aquimarina sp. SS2-1]|uniref:hypothetical protein n=1 Tax=Aquimarina besae TaxID=3342247 RepID=UPI00366BF1D5